MSRTRIRVVRTRQMGRGIQGKRDVVRPDEMVLVRVAVTSQGATRGAGVVSGPENLLVSDAINGGDQAPQKLCHDREGEMKISRSRLVIGLWFQSFWIVKAKRMCCTPFSFPPSRREDTC